MPRGLTLLCHYGCYFYRTLVKHKPSRPVNTRSELVPTSGLSGPDQVVGDLGQSCSNPVTVYHRDALDQTSIQVDEKSLMGGNRENTQVG